MRRVGLVGCAKLKVGRPACARDLYVSPLFKLARRYVEATCDAGWGVLSARHGLVLPDTIIAPYDATLVGQSVAVRRAWGRRAWQAISTTWDPADTVFVLLAGHCYEPAVTAAPHVERPLAGLSIGQRLAHLKRAAAAE